MKIFSLVLALILASINLAQADDTVNLDQVVVEASRSNDTVGDLRILLLSASVDEQSQSIGIEAGADYFLAKPFSPRELATWLSVGKEPR